MTLLRRFQRGSHGFTLVEVICALVIFSVAIVGFMQSLASATRLQSDLGDEQRAMMLTQNILEELRYSGRYEIGTEEGQFEAPDDRFSWRTDIEEVADFDGLIKATATVNWTTGVQRESSLSTLIAQADRQE